MNAHYVILSLLSFVLSFTGSLVISIYGHRLGLLDNPNVRSSHHSATPRGGGIGVLAAFIVVSTALQIPTSFWLPASILSIISLFDDRRDFSRVVRLVFQFGASFFFLIGFWQSLPSQYANYIVIFPLSIFIVGTANYYNFMDGINGIAGIAGVVGFGLLSIYGYITGTSAILIVLTTSISFSCLGFLPFNFPRARVFMGDVGSILLGFVFATMAIQLSNSISDFLCLLSFMFPFYADEITTEVIRLKIGEKLWQPHRRHLYQLLANEYQIPHWIVSLGYGLLQLIVGASILFTIESGITTAIFLIILYFLIFVLISNIIRRNLPSNTN